ncbi:MAG: response regulator [Methanobacterium sp.]|nr:response regulator [Methanobacterium sp.]
MNEIEGITVLLVEDNPADVRLIKEVFNGFQIKNDIIDIGDGKEAMDYLYKKGNYKNAKTPSIILLDLNLPKKDGREILKEIKNHDELKIIPVIILTTSNDKEDIYNAYKHHANAYLVKPVDFKEFEETISSLEDFWLTKNKFYAFED